MCVCCVVVVLVLMFCVLFNGWLVGWLVERLFCLTHSKYKMLLIIILSFICKYDTLSIINVLMMSKRNKKKRKEKNIRNHSNNIVLYFIHPFLYFCTHEHRSHYRWILAAASGDGDAMKSDGGDGE